MKSNLCLYKQNTYRYHFLFTLYLPVMLGDRLRTCFHDFDRLEMQDTISKLLEPYVHQPVLWLWIRKCLFRIRIRGSVILNYASESRSRTGGHQLRIRLDP
jgi:hypothetical protein